MKTTKIKLKKPIYFLKRVFDKYSDWRVYKTRPTRSGEQDVVYKVTQKTIVTINKNEIIDIINADIQGYETSEGAWHWQCIHRFDVRIPE